MESTLVPAGRFIGRIGTLAVMLGVGLAANAVIGGPGIAGADTDSDTSAGADGRAGA